MHRRALLAALPGLTLADTDKLPPVRQITQGPKFHWFGYYDKLQFDVTNRYVLGMEVDFEHRSPKPGDKIRIGMVDLKDNHRWIDLGETGAWCWQQGCMLQWLPGSKTEVIYNDRDGDTLISHILDVRGGKKRTLPGPVYCVSPDAQWAVNPDFGRLNDTRPGYGYPVADPFQEELAPAKTGIWRMNLKTGKRDLILSYADVAAHPYKLASWTGSKHKINHLLYSPSGRRFIFLHRRRGGPNPESGATRMFTCKPDGSDLFVVDPYGFTSHFIWRDDQHIMAWARHPSHGSKFYLYEDKAENVQVMAPDRMPENGHNTYLPGNRWILNDTYPDKQRVQHPYLYDTRTNRRHPLGHFLSPREYTGEWRCDTHPRYSRDGKLVCIDSPHNGGRQLYLIDISRIIA